MPGFSEEIRKLHQDSGIVELFELDATKLGGLVHRITPYWLDGGTLLYQTNTYKSYPFASMGWELTNTGTLPRPTLQVSNVEPEFLQYVKTLGDLVGMKVKRFFTYEKYLDGKPDADPDAHSRMETYYVEQKIQHNDISITWQLCSPIDKANFLLPRRMYLKDPIPPVEVAPGEFISYAVFAPGLARYEGSA